MLNTSNKLSEEINLINFMSDLFSAYQEVAVMKMQRIRSLVLQNRRFMEEVYTVFNESKIIYSKRVSNAMGEGTPDDLNLSKFSTLNKNGKSVIVLISTDQKFSGDIIFRVFNSFFERVNSSTEVPDIILVGHQGKQLFDGKNTGLEYTFYDLKSFMSAGALEELEKQLIQYEKIDVYFGKFINILRQQEAVGDISGNTSSLMALQSTKVDDYLFEPSIEQIINFFEIQIMSALLKQTIAESELARLGSRINAMEIATNNAQNSVRKLKKDKVMADKSYWNNKQIERLTGFTMWGND